MRILNRRWLDRPLHVLPGDTVSVTYTKDGHARTLASAAITEPGTFNEALVFEDEIEGRRAIGGAVLEQEGS